MKRILLIDSNRYSQKNITKQLGHMYTLDYARDASEAVIAADKKIPDAVVMELTLAGHSGLEFLYEFRTYPDWRDLPLIVYSTIKLSAEVLNSAAWKQLAITEYLYKPEASLERLAFSLEKALA